MKKGKRLLALFLTLCLLLGMVPAPAFAEETEEVDTVVKELRFYPDCESDAYSLINTAEEGVVINFNTTLNPYKFEILFEDPESIGRAWLSSTVNGKRRTLAATYDKETGLFTAEGYFNSEDRYYVPTNVRVEYSPKANIPAVGEEVDWSEVKGYLSAELENALVINTNTGSDSTGTVDFASTVEDLESTVMDYAIDVLDDATGGVLEEVRSNYQTAENIVSYFVEGVDDTRYQVWIDVSDSENLKILLDDGLDVGSKAIELSMKFLDTTSNTYQTLEVISDTMGHVGQAADVLKDLYDISQEMDGIRDEIEASDDLSDEERESVTQAVDSLEQDQMLFVLLATALPIVVTGGAATPAAAAIFTGMVGVISAASEAVYDYRIAGVKDEIAVAGFESASVGNSSNGFWWDFNSGALTIGGTGYLTSTSIPDWHYYIGSQKYILKNRDVTSVQIMSGIEGIYNGSVSTFYFAEQVTLPDSVHWIGSQAFLNYYKLTDIELPNNLQTFHTDAFSGCKNLTSLTLPESLTELNGGIFDSTYLKDVYYEGTIEQWEQIEGYENVADFNVYPGEWSSAGTRIHMNNSGTFGDGLAWSFNEEMQTLTISGEGEMTLEELETDDIYVYPWRHCGPWIRTVVIEEGITALPERAFAGYPALEEVYLPSTLEEAGNEAFYGCTALTTAQFAEGIRYIPSFVGCTALTEVQIPAGAAIGYQAFDNCTALQTVEIAEGITTIGSYAFRNCDSLTTVDLPDSLEELGGNAFAGCDNLTEMHLPEGVTYVTGGAFAGCTGLQTVTFSPETWWLGQYAFRDCTALEQIIIPASVTKIAEECFARCTALKEITFLGNPPEIQSYSYTEMDVFEGVTANAHYPAGNVSWTTQIMKKYGGDLTWDAPVLKILTQPVSVTAEDGATASVAVEAEGDDPKYAWYRAEPGEEEFVLDASFTGPEYSVTMSRELGGVRVYCVITDDRGDTVTTDTVSLNRIPACVAILKQPEDVTVAEGEEAVVSFEAEGVDLEYCWYYKAPSYDTFYLTWDFTGNTYSKVMTAELSGWQVYCEVSDGAGNSVQTNVVTLYVEDAAPRNEVQIVTEPVGVTVASGEKATVTVEAEGDGLTYEWYYRDADDSGFRKTTTFTSNTYSVTMNAARSGRQVYCIVADQYGNTARTDTVTLSLAQYAEILTQPVSVTAADGEKATVSFEAAGDGLTYTWYYKNAGDSSFSKTTAFTTNSYSVTMSAARDGRQVYCVVTDRYGSQAQTDTVTLSMAKNEVQIVTQPKSVWVAEGEKASVTVEAEGDGLTYKWYYKNPGASKYTYTSSFKGDTYSITMNEARDGRYVFCKVTDAYGNTVKSKTVSLNMKTPLEIVTQPKSVKVAEGEKATVTVEAKGDGLTYKWYYKNPGASSYSYTSSFTGNSYSITMNEDRDGRYVFCRIYDKWGNMVKTNTVSLRMK